MSAYRVLAVIGAGGHGCVIADAAIVSSNWKSIVFFDDHVCAGSFVKGWPCQGKTSLLSNFKTAFSNVVIGIGNNHIRLSLTDEMADIGHNLVTVLHPAATISKQTTLGIGSVVFAGAVINIGATIGRACIINTGALIDHDCRLGDAVHISPGAVLAGGVNIGSGVWVGAGATVIEGVSVGRNTVIAAGATVIRDLPDGVVAMGTPARVVKKTRREPTAR